MKRLLLVLIFIVLNIMFIRDSLYVRFPLGGDEGQYGYIYWCNQTECVGWQLVLNHIFISPHPKEKEEVRK